MSINSKNVNTKIWFGMIITCILFAFFFSLSVAQWPNLGDIIHNAVETVKKAGKDVHGEFERIPGNTSTARNDITQAAEKARDDITAELNRIPSNIEAQARANAEEFMASQLDQLRRAVPVQPDILEQQIKLAVFRLIPGYDLTRLGLIAKNIAQAADHFRLVNAHGNNLVNKVQGWPQNNENLTPFCNGMQTHSEQMFSPFLSGPEADLMNLRASVQKISSPIQNMINSICDVIYKGQDLVNQGKEVQAMTADSIKSTILTQMNVRFRAAFQQTLTEMIVAVTSPF